MNQIAPDILRQLLRYDAETGKLFWRERGPEWFKSDGQGAEKACKKWNTVWAGREAFTAVGKSGHQTGAVFAKNFLKHRVIWAMHYGWPEDLIDHIDGDPGNNRIENLRPANQGQNKANAGKRWFRNPSSRYIGVSWSRKERKWIAQVGHAGTTSRAGCFTCETTAAIARDRLAKDIKGEFARLNFPELRHV
ncbi:hypothetical protein GL279_00285 [Paracoccus limosus]|uniref:AP2/ERF domain-containing protein n=1 Tax=Paracoccus limosus TaxID=913252 RepID=A0A844GZ15_9RHOB|nr:HNH endonuclease [Paracoccus limosus]MTH33035.1 hypothetical protein [Paracoccus limosus]